MSRSSEVPSGFWLIFGHWVIQLTSDFVGMCQINNHFPKLSIHTITMKILLSIILCIKLSTLNTNLNTCINIILHFTDKFSVLI